MLSKWPAFSKFQDATTEITAQVIQVRVESVSPASEVQVVGEEDGLLISESFCYLHMQLVGK